MEPAQFFSTEVYAMAEQPRYPLHPAEAEAEAELRQGDFVRVILPRVTGAVRRKFWWRADVEDLAQDAALFAWYCFLRALARGVEPLRNVRRVCKWAVSRAVGHAEGLRDVLSGRAQRAKGFRVTAWTDEVEGLIAERRHGRRR
jgi:hypothetical protein